MVTLSRDLELNINSFISMLDGSISLDTKVETRLDETRQFIQYLLDHKIKVYGLTTGFADLRNTSILPSQAADLSVNLIHSHDAGIGEPLPSDVTLGAMIIRAHSLAKGYSGFTCGALNTLIGMINARIIPLIPSTGSLGASGDLAYLSRLGRAMMGEDVPVTYQGEVTSAKVAMQRAGIPLFHPQAKEGLALTNGTPFMASMLALAYQKEESLLNSLLSLTGMFLNSVGAVDAAYYGSLQAVRGQTGQMQLAAHLKGFMEGSDLIDRVETQNDYCIRCLPQIYGPRFEMILEQKGKIEQELNAVTDNPLIFRDHEISLDIHPSRLFSFNDSTWAVLSGGNFHGENLTTIADLIGLSNGKIALTIERQITYLMNPFRNKNKLPSYLVCDQKNVGLNSGFMILQYTANALAHKICLLGQPSGLANITSANESEDVVSYGATACHRLLQQLTHLEELVALFLVAVSQSYAMRRNEAKSRNEKVEALFECIQKAIPLPRKSDEPFDQLYQAALNILKNQEINRFNLLSLGKLATETLSKS
jgi:histidine ammonia-lyase